jgi:DNA end-binding protein Ku
MLQPRDKGIVLWTLRYGDEVRAEKEYFSDIKSERVDSKMMGLVTKLIEERKRPWNENMVEDPVQKSLKQIIAAKKKGLRPAKGKAVKHAEPPSNVIDIMEALRKSVASGQKRPSRG